jgi:hypothetical protein
MGLQSKRLRESARGRFCTLGFPGVCNHDKETTVLAHLPSDVQGIGVKSDDFHAVFACHACHVHMDQHLPHPNMAGYQLRALQRTQKWWFDNGLFRIVADKDEPVARKTSKITPPPRKMFEEK